MFESTTAPGRVPFKRRSLMRRLMWRGLPEQVITDYERFEAEMMHRGSSAETVDMAWQRIRAMTFGELFANRLTDLSFWLVMDRRALWGQASNVLLVVMCSGFMVNEAWDGYSHRDQVWRLVVSAILMAVHAFLIKVAVGLFFKEKHARRRYLDSRREVTSCLRAMADSSHEAQLMKMIETHPGAL